MNFLKDKANYGRKFCSYNRIQWNLRL